MGCLRPNMALCAAIFTLAASKDVRIGREAVFDSEVRDVHWLGQDKRTLLLLTGQYRLHRSGDGGEAWEDITPKLQQLGDSPSMQVGRIVKSPATRDSVVVLARPEPAGFASTDAGLTWRRLEVDAALQSWMAHPTRPMWALMSYWSGACDGLAPSSNKSPCSHNLYVTQDLGRTFQLVSTHVIQFSWGSRIGSQEDLVYFTRFRDKTVFQTRLSRWMEGTEFVLTSDFGRTVAVLVDEGNKFQISNGFILVVKVLSMDRQEVSLMVSSNGGDTFEAAKLPRNLKQRSYTLLDTSEGAIVLHVNHRGGTLGDVYVSDASGVKFSLSLSNNVRRRGLCAFEKVMNLNGIYIANIQAEPPKEPAPAGADEKEEAQAPDAEGASASTQTEEQIRWLQAEDAAAADWDEEAGGAEGPALLSQAEEARQLRVEAAGRTRNLASAQDWSASSATSRGGRRTSVGEDSVLTGVRTVISFDMGGAWHYLAPPQVDSEGKAVGGCDKPSDCTLHLHGFTDLFTFAPVYSYRNAVGILMGSGNVGRELNFERAKTSTYLSRDGGLTWMEVHKGTFIYEYGNHGGLVVMADMAGPTTSIIYSWDEGKSWKTVNFSTELMSVSNVLIEPDATDTKFVMYGHRGSSGVLHLIDFGELHQRLCKGISQVGSPSSDYEHWSPSDGSGGERCILGHHTVITRRKQLSQCFNEETLERPSFVKNCPCTKESFECEVGFARAFRSLDCREDPNAITRSAPPPPADCTQQYWVNAYRRVPGDTCAGGWAPQKVPLPCPARSTLAAAAPTEQPTHTAAATGFVIVCAAAALFVALRRESVQGWLHDVMGLQTARVVNGRYAGCRPPPGGPGPDGHVGAEMVGRSGAPGYSPPSF